MSVRAAQTARASVAFTDSGRSGYQYAEIRLGTKCFE